eukprot:86262-Chlamydomonas_euryale.AAC.1
MLTELLESSALCRCSMSDVLQLSYSDDAAPPLQIGVLLNLIKKRAQQPCMLSVPVCMDA